MTNQEAIGDFELAIDDTASKQEVMTWNNLVSDSICEMRFITDKPNSHLSSNWRHFDFGHITMNCFRNNNSFRVIHEPSLKQVTQNKYFELVYTDSPIELNHYNRQVSIPENTFFLLDNSEDFEIKIQTHSSLGISLHLDPNWLIQWIPNPKLSVAQPCSGDTGWGRVLLVVLETIEQQQDPEKTLPRSLLADQLGSLLSLLLLPQENSQLKTRHQISVYSQLERVLHENYQNPDLSPQLAADKTGVSKRHLFNIFTKAGTTFNSELMKIRLERSHVMLKDEKFNSFRVCDIAWACGFSDSSHFARRFKAFYDYSPSKHRKS